MTTTTVTGQITVHPRGFGFLRFLPDQSIEETSAFIPPNQLNFFLEGDEVSANVKVDENGRHLAEPLSLLSRQRKKVFGTVSIKKGNTYLQIDREIANCEWPLDTKGETLKTGDAVIALATEEKSLLLEKKLAKEEVSLTRIIVRHTLYDQYEPETLKEAKEASQKEHTLQERRDLRQIPTITVDSASTRDVDDAISVLPAEQDGALRLFISIADVAAFVPEGSALDQEAQKRATSVYLPGNTLPMFPQNLSSEWLSLLPEEDRSCLTIELRIDPEGQITSIDVYESLICSNAKLSYQEVAQFLDTGRIHEALQPVKESMPWFRTAASRLGLTRAQRGGIELSREESRIKFDPESGTAIGIESIRPTSAHTMIERFMVAANEAIATWMFDRGIPTIYRVHEQPEPQQATDLSIFARNFGFETGFGPILSPLSLAAFETQIRGAPTEPAIRSVMLRTLGPARYTVYPGAHFGLAAPLYSHFTSPIRRYADLCIHRMIKKYLHGYRDFIYQDPQIETLAQELGKRARFASRAERNYFQVLAATIMSEKIGHTFSARVTRVRPFGLIAQLDETHLEGILPMESLPNGPYKFQEQHSQITGETRNFSIGVPIEVKVKSCDTTLGRIEFMLVSAKS